MGERLGRVVGLWRYPVKSMLGERVESAHIGPKGLWGDRARALLDVESGRVVSAKFPRKWSRMFGLAAAYAEEPSADGAPARAVVTFPDGSALDTGDAELADRLSRELGRAVTLVSEPPSENATYEAVALGTTDGEMQEHPVRSAFFDLSPMHLVTTATLSHLRSLYPEGGFQVERYRPNMLIETPDGESGFVENAWPGKVLAIGEVRLRVLGPMIRCVMTTLPQSGAGREALAGDPRILKTAAQHNSANVGVAVMVVAGGRVREGDGVEEVSD